MNYLLFDVETTGFKYDKDFVLSIGAVLLNDDLGLSRPITKDFYTFLDWTQVPLILWRGCGAVDVHGITEERLKNSPMSCHPVNAISKFVQFVSEFMDELDAQGVHTNRNVHAIVAHNSSFDVNMIRATLLFLQKRYATAGGTSLFDVKSGEAVQDVTFPQEDVYNLEKAVKLFCKETSSAFFVDTLMIDRIFHFEEDGIKLSHDLESIGLRYGLGENEEAHDALADTRRLKDIFLHHLQELAHMGIQLDKDFESRLAFKWKREKERFRENGTEDYFGRTTVALDV